MNNTMQQSNYSQYNQYNQSTIILTSNSGRYISFHLEILRLNRRSLSLWRNTWVFACYMCTVLLEHIVMDIREETLFIVTI